MWYAIDVRTGKQIHADNGSRYRTYRCPVCEGEVFLRGGQHYAHHFAHRHATAKPECELYTPGKSRIDPHRAPAHPFTYEGRVAKDKLGITPPSICIEVENRQLSGRGRIPRWSLCIAIPKSVDGRGRISFDLGAASPRTIALSKLFGGPATYPANPDANDFKAVWCSPETDPAYRDIISERRPGLNKQGVTPFMSVRGRYKPRARRLVWGRAYYFVWPKSFDPKFPSALDVLAFEKIKDWSCVLCALPESRDDILADWLDRVCSVDIESSSATWSLLYPFLSAYAYNGDIEIPAIGPLIVGCNQTGETDEVKTKAYAIVNGERIETQVPDQSKSVVALTFSDIIPDVFELAGNHQVSFSFRAPEVQSFGDHSIAWGEFESATRGWIRVPMHTPGARRWLEEVRANRAQLNGITLPEAFRGELAWRSNPIAAWNRSPLNRNYVEGRRWLHQVKLGRDELELIQSVLKSTGDEVLLSFRGLGEHHFLSVEAEDDRVVRLSRRLRNRMLWLQKEISLVYGDGQPVADNVSDHDLVQCFLALTPPTSLAGHYQSIRRSVSEPLTKRESLGID